VSRSGRGPVSARAAREHRAALDAFLQTAAGIPPERWSEPLGAGRWTPAQVAQHLLLVYEVLLSQLAGGPPLPMRAGPLKSRLLRWFILPHILFHRSLPRGVSAPPAVAAVGEGIERGALAARFQATAERVEGELRATAHRHFVHPLFGRVPLPRALPFLAVHMEHHRRQLAPLASSPRPELPR
jgi:hypothetical protein